MATSVANQEIEALGKKLNQVTTRVGFLDDQYRADGRCPICTEQVDPFLWDNGDHDCIAILRNKEADLRECVWDRAQGCDRGEENESSGNEHGRAPWAAAARPAASYRHAHGRGAQSRPTHQGRSKRSSRAARSGSSASPRPYRVRRNCTWELRFAARVS